MKSENEPRYEREFLAEHTKTALDKIEEVTRGDYKFSLDARDTRTLCRLTKVFLKDFFVEVFL
jgi:hypothetical protein